MHRFLSPTTWRRIVSRVMPLRHALWYIMTGEAHISYSQLGEDMLLRSFLNARLLDVDYKGFWVDIGAHHPSRFSNTKIFYDRGWRGINVDASPTAIKHFNRARPRDTNINVGIGEFPGKLAYFKFADSATNTFSQEFAEKAKAEGATYLGSTLVQVTTLRELLDKYLTPHQHIDFLTIDTEGLDISILRSNDWTTYRPDYILIEIHGDGHNEKILNGTVCQYLHEQGYEFAAQSLITTLFKKIR